MTRIRRAAVALALAVLVAGCSTATEPDDSRSPTPESAQPSPVSSGPSPDPAGPTAEPSDSPSPSPDAGQDGHEDGPVETYLAWLEASRVPEPETACGYLSDDLIERMLEEYRAHYGSDPGDCESLTTMTAELYRAFGISAEVSIEVSEEDQQRAVLFVTYVDVGDCGTIVLQRSGPGWLITDESEGCSAP